MIEVLFSLQFQSQLRRTRDDVLRSLHAAMVAAVAETGGRPIRDAKGFSALYDEDVLAFPLDLAGAVEDLVGALTPAAAEFYGHALVIKDREVPAEPRLLRVLYGSAAGLGIWCDPRSRSMLEPYAEFYDSEVSEFRELKALRHESPSSATAAAAETPSLPSVSCALVLGSEDRAAGALHAHYRRHAQELEPIIVSFGFGGTGLACICDGISDELLRLLCPGNTDAAVEVFKRLKKNRLRETIPGASTEAAADLLLDLIQRYGSYADTHRLRGVVAFEHLDRADSPVRELSFRLHEACRKFAGISAYLGAASEELFSSRDLQVFTLRRGYAAEGTEKREITGELRELLYGIEEALACIPAQGIPALLSEEGKSRRSVERALAILVDKGLIVSVDRPIPLRPGESLAGAPLEDAGRDRVRSFLRRRMLAQVGEGRLAPAFRLLRILHALGSDCGDDLVLDSLEQDIRCGAYGDISAAMATGEFESLVGAGRAECLRLLVPGAVALLHGDADAAAAAFAEPLPPSYPSLRYEAYMLCDRAAYRLGEGNTQAALIAVKRALICLQDLPNEAGLCRAYRLFGLTHIALQRVGDGVEYLSFALETAERAADLYEDALCSLFMAGAQFLVGNYSKADRYAARAELLAGKADLPGWARRALFFRGRILFETGRYRDAAEIFDVVGGELGAPWSRRCGLYEGRTAEAARSGSFESLEELLFAVESEFLAGRYDGVLALTENGVESEPSRRFVLVEQAAPRGGYAHCEDAAFPDGDFIHRHLKIFRALALGSGNSFERRAEALELLRLMLKESTLPDADPYDAFYYYAQYRILKETGASELDISTALSVAFKRLQRRAGRTDDLETKRSFLFLNRWNADLMAAAKANNLI